MQTLYIKNLKSLPDVASKFLDTNKEHKIFAFFGDLGSGKTTFIKAICNELNVIDIVSSPTFSLINEYRSKEGHIIYHMDFYRINSLDEALNIGIEDYLTTNNYCFIEWPEKIESLLPNQTTYIKISEDEEKGRILNIY
ncbi:MAG: tRNA (adenosine(37)-N6)-threonylcarbamoyltransferase complex ATPase subunit type 1 TsaE [Bacteroidales bacterium]|nr:tRNA (adenosine(37)-N6)-threonylcarbamoyltransferase complex ATPase subunit type 1 TsaE [Bacteroidales bacterium]MBS3773824.1 tRNA (adenosine(37)-N6)-threonylcarbamoyltransferase complex ATPase subunit type 1 TsaE [Bacteroidales bacterium]